MYRIIIYMYNYTIYERYDNTHKPCRGSLGCSFQVVRYRTPDAESTPDDV